MAGARKKSLTKEEIQKKLNSYYRRINQLTLDHVKPRSKGGQDLTTNVVCACRKCNADKGSSHWLGWMRKAFGFQPLRELLIHQHIIKGT